LRCSLTRAEYRGMIPSLVLLATQKSRLSKPVRAPQYPTLLLLALKLTHLDLTWASLHSLMLFHTDRALVTLKAALSYLWQLYRVYIQILLLREPLNMCPTRTKAHSKMCAVRLTGD